VNQVKIAGLIQDSIVDGPGLRFALFTQGCNIGCEGCQNPESLDATGGMEMSVSEIISQMLSNPLTDGLTLSGGEPFMQSGDCSQIAAEAQKNGLNVWVFTGNIFENLLERAKSDKDINDLLMHIDVLVDGPFEIEKRSLALKWRGSKNQRLIDIPKSLKLGEAVLISES